MKLHRQMGFTLMEMLIVVAVIAILVGIAVPTFAVSLEKSKETADKASIRDMFGQIATEANMQMSNFPTSVPEALANSLNYSEKLEWNKNGSGKIVYNAESVEPYVIDISAYLTQTSDD